MADLDSSTVWQKLEKLKLRLLNELNMGVIDNGLQWFLDYLGF
jgi:hypothetical protein